MPGTVKIKILQSGWQAVGVEAGEISLTLFSKAKGFTLLEVMVALAVLAISLGALSKGVSNYLGNASYLQDRTLATWVAEDRITELQILQAWPKADTTKGSVQMAGREWYWVQTVTTVEGRPEIRQVRMQVLEHPDDKHPLATLISLIGQPQK